MTERALRARTFHCEGTDLAHVASYLRAHPFVDRDSVTIVAESHRVAYDLDFVTVPTDDIACADLAVRRGAESVAGSHRWPA